MQRLLLTGDFPGSFVRYVSERETVELWGADEIAPNRADRSCTTCGFHLCECIDEYGVESKASSAAAARSLKAYTDAFKTLSIGRGACECSGCTMRVFTPQEIDAMGADVWDAFRVKETKPCKQSK